MKIQADYAALQVVVGPLPIAYVFFIHISVTLISSQWSPTMYSIIDAEFFVSCFFFIDCIIVSNIWLINLFVAVTTNTFSAIRADTKKSAFGAALCVFLTYTYADSNVSNLTDYLCNIMGLLDRTTETGLYVVLSL